MEKIERIRHSIVFRVFAFLLLTGIEYVILECFLDGNIPEIGLEYGIKNIAILAGVNLALTALAGRLRPAFLVSETVVFLFGMINYFVDSFRGYGLVYMDLFAVKTAANVAGEYSYHIGLPFLAGCIWSVIGILGCFLVPAGRKKKEPGKRISWKNILLRMGQMAAAAVFFAWISLSPDFWTGISNLTWDHNIGMAEYGYLLYVTANAGESTVSEPEGYSPEKADEILNRYRDADQVNSVLADHSGNVENPNLIMIMNESFSDLSVLGDFETNRPYLSYFNSMQENTIRGYAESSVYGGYTANSEFEFLTGCSKAFLPGNPYLQYIDDYLPTIISNLKTQKAYKQALAMHPYNPSGYNRNRVYPLLHFDEFLSMDAFKKPEKVRKYISDAADFDKIKQLYEQKEKGTSLCLFNVTMQNHSPYDETGYTFAEPVEMTDGKYQFQANQYLSLIKKTDDAWKDLTEYFQKVDEPTLIVMFGDHQPHLPDNFYKLVMGHEPDELTDEENMKRYLVPFVIWANYDIPEEQIERTSINYLSVLAMQTAGIELTDYQKFLLDLYQKVPSVSANGYYDNQGRLHKWSEMGNETSKLMDEYEIVQYNYLFDKENRKDAHYQLGH